MCPTCVRTAGEELLRNLRARESPDKTNTLETLARQSAVGPNLFQRQLLRRSQVDRFDSGCLGLMMLRLDEVNPEEPEPDATTLPGSRVQALRRGE
jgi:hypothetical protein